MLQQYELLYIVPAKYGEQEVGRIQENVKNLFSKNQGEISKEDSLGILRLAYPIKGVNQGHYFTIEFSIEGAGLREVASGLKIMSGVLRHQLVKKAAGSEKQLVAALFEEKKKKLEEQRQEQQAADQERAREPLTKESKEVKVTMEELDKRLDKLLDSDII